MAIRTLQYVDDSKEFWPHGWMVYACILVGSSEVLGWAWLIYQVVHHH